MRRRKFCLVADLSKQITRFAESVASGPQRKATEELEVSRRDTRPPCHLCQR